VHYNDVNGRLKPRLKYRVTL